MSGFKPRPVRPPRGTGLRRGSDACGELGTSVVQLPNLNVQCHQASRSNACSEAVARGWGLEFCLYSKLPEGPRAAGWWTRLGAGRG